MKKIVVIEDEALSAQRIARFINDYDPEIAIDGPLKTVEDVESFLSSEAHYDLIVSDIRLGQRTVFEAFERYKPKSFVVFITAYDDYAMQAIKNNGLEYLMKPIDYEEFCDAIGKLKLAMPANQNVLNLQSEAINKAAPFRERFLLTKGDELIVVNAKDIDYFSIDGDHVCAFCNDGKSYALALSMAELEQELNPNDFFRLNRQYIANLNGFKRISLYFGSKLIVELKGCENDIVLSKKKSAMLKKWLNK
jgi:DNA-binding LytR/AlgR family response regulator